MKVGSILTLICADSPYVRELVNSTYNRHKKIVFWLSAHPNAPFPPYRHVKMQKAVV